MKLQHRKSKETLEFPCLRDFSDAEGDTVAEFPVLTDGCNFLTGLLFAMCLDQRSDFIKSDKCVFIVLFLFSRNSWLKL